MLHVRGGALEGHCLCAGQAFRPALSTPVALSTLQLAVVALQENLRGRGRFGLRCSGFKKRGGPLCVEKRRVLELGRWWRCRSTLWRRLTARPNRATTHLIEGANDCPHVAQTALHTKQLNSHEPLGTSPMQTEPAPVRVSTWPGYVGLLAPWPCPPHHSRRVQSSRSISPMRRKFASMACSLALTFFVSCEVCSDCCSCLRLFSV